ncbi:UvrD-helicase domain-containing protein [Craterilacuibacter sinensis]|uniref:DNA 3'-5' helicase n=1 Tax=Craterilacuibacter sinensis TaxID=2686017 RepID=A0A845BMU3_9NEIS|nr:ATP-dependent helicase [Craterilacuibacter sinensis]MXR37702.1 AAA family ATPase [Craterilacuibacter sinensis]
MVAKVRAHTRLALSAEQQAVLDHSDGHLLIEAAAGSGKTTLLALLALQHAHSGGKVLALTFSRSGKASLQQRLAEHGSRSDAITVQSFDEVCMGEAGRLLADERQLVKKDWVLEHVLPQVVAEVNQAIAGSDELQLPQDAASLTDLLDTFQSIKQGRLAALLAYEEDAEVIAGTLQRPHAVWLAYLAYENRRRTLRLERYTGFRLIEDACHDLMDALEQDLLLAPGRFNASCLFIDEFHDTSPLQLAWLLAWGGQVGKLVAVGDRDQVLYSWRGADAESVFAGFRRQLPKVTVLPLSASYRFGPLLAARVQPLRSPRLPVLAGAGCATEIEAAHGHLAQVLAANPYPAGDTALIARDRGQTVAAQLALTEAGIPFYTLDGWPCWRNSEGMLIQALAQLIAPTWSAQSAQQNDQKKLRYERERRERLARRLVTLPGWCLNDKRQRELGAMVAESGEHWPLLAQWLTDLPPPVHPAQRSQLLALQQALATLTSHNGDAKLADALAVFSREARLLSTLRAYAPWGEAPDSRVQGWQALCRHIAQQGFSAAQWLARCERLNWMHWKAEQDAAQALAVGSVFHAKGKQWPHVILTGMDEQAFPLPGAPMAEEKRRAYVAATRAQNQLTLHCAAEQEPGRFYRLLAGEAGSGA